MANSLSESGWAIVLETLHQLYIILSASRGKTSVKVPEPTMMSSTGSTSSDTQAGIGSERSASPLLVISGMDSLLGLQSTPPKQEVRLFVHVEVMIIYSQLFCDLFIDRNILRAKKKIYCTAHLRRYFRHVLTWMTTLYCN